MDATMSCPVCHAAGITFGAPQCPHCHVRFSAPVVPPVVAGPVASPPAILASESTESAEPAATPIPVYASIWRRIAAAVVDGIILAIPFVLLVGPREYFASSTEGGVAFTSGSGMEWLQFLVYTTYVVTMQASSRQATLGMQLLGTRLVGEDDLQRVGAGRVLARELLTLLSAFILMIGYLMIAFTQKRQALHDKLAHTLVVHEPSR